MTYSKKDKKEFDLDYCLNAIKTFKTQKDSLIKLFREGRRKGTPTGVKDIDQTEINGRKSSLWSWKLGEMNLWTGYNNEGKSQFLIFLCLLKAIDEGWKFAFFSPENDPPDEFFDDLIHTMLGKTTDNTQRDFNITEKEYMEAYKKIEDSFFFVYPEDEEGKPDYSIENIEKIFEYLIFEHGVKGLILDPYIKIKHEMKPGEPEHLYASRFMMDRVHFSRKHNISYHLVMHQTTPRRDKDIGGNYPPPNLYNIKGGGTFADSTDNVLTIHRPNRVSDPTDTLVTFSSDKIKKHKLVGIPGSCQIRFDRRKNRYVSLDGFDYFDGSRKIEEKSKEDSSVYDVYRADKFSQSGINDFDFPSEDEKKDEPF